MISFFPSILSYPFDWRKPIGFAACILIQSLLSYTIVNVYAFTLSSTIGHCIFAAAFISDLEVHLRELNDQFRGMIHENAQNQLEIRRKFIEIIQFHSNARE